jgi:hypothetical protein
MLCAKSVPVSPLHKGRRGHLQNGGALIAAFYSEMNVPDEIVNP